jgi:large subunit ribosomal protein L10
MKKQEKVAIVAELKEHFDSNGFVYLADTNGLSANQTNQLRRLLHENGVSMRMVKNTLLTLAMQESDKDFDEIINGNVLTGTTCVMFSENIKAPAKSIQKFRKSADMPLLKGAWVDGAVFIGDQHLSELTKLKSKEDLIGDVIALLQSPAKNVISGLQGSAGHKIAGLVKALEERN